jgi:hypothetical protein
LSLVHRCATLNTAAAFARCRTERRRIGLDDDVDDSSALVQLLWVDRHRIAGMHTNRRRVDDDVVPSGIGGPHSRVAATCRLADAVSKLPRLGRCDIADRQHARAGLRDGKRNRASSSAGAHE